MRNVLGRLLMWVAEILDRNLLTVPDVDENYPPSAGPQPIHRGLITARAADAQDGVHE